MDQKANCANILPEPGELFLTNKQQMQSVWLWECTSVCAPAEMVSGRDSSSSDSYSVSHLTECKIDGPNVEVFT